LDALIARDNAAAPSRREPYQSACVTTATLRPPHGRTSVTASGPLGEANLGTGSACDLPSEHGRASRKALEVSDYTYLRWHNQYGGPKADDANELRRLKNENGRLKRVVADVTLDNAILREAARGDS
jgi:hypothetical protein